MSKRKRRLRAAEILLVAVFILVLFAVEGAVVADWFSSSMKSALNKVMSSINESISKSLDDFDQQLWAEERLVTLAAYYLENDALEADTEDSLSHLCELFNADGAYLIHKNGKMIVGYGACSQGNVFQQERYEAIRSVSKESPYSGPILLEENPENASEDEEDDTLPFFQSYCLDSGKILVLQRRVAASSYDPDSHLAMEWSGFASNRVFGSNSFCFVTSEDDSEILFLSQEDEDNHSELADAKVPEEARKAGFTGLIELEGTDYFCCTMYSPALNLYAYCVVPAVSFYLAVLFVSASVLIVTFFFLLLMRMYTRLLLPDAVRNLKKKEPDKSYRRNLLILLLAAAVATVTVNIFTSTLYLYTERVQTNSDQSEQLADILDGFEAKQQASSTRYNAFIATITQASAELIPQSPEFMKAPKLQELADVMGAARILVYDNSGSVTASSRNYSNLSLSTDPGSMSYEFRWVLQGEPLLIQDKPDANYLKNPYRFSGAAMTDPEGNFTGMVQIAMHPSVFEKMESSISMNTVLAAFETEKKDVALAVDADTKEVLSPDEMYSDETAEKLGIAEEVLQDDFTGFFTIRKDEMIGSCHSCDEYYAIVASPTEQIPSAGFRSGLLTALPGILTEAAYVLILIIYVRNCSMMTEEEIHAIEKGRKKEENMLREQMHDFAYRFLYVLCAVVSLLYFFRYSLFPKGSIEYYIFANEWARGFHIFSFTRCLIYIAVAVFVLATVSRLGTAVASLLMSRQETFVRMGLSFLKYGVGIATVFVCASLLGAPTASLLASAGVLSVVLSFGAQNIVADIIAGLFIVFEGTFKVGDMITVDDWHGQVQEIGIRNTTIRDLILEDVKIMNNSTIRSIINYSERPCWSPITVGVDYDTDIPALEAAFEREKAGMKKNIPLGIGEIVYLGIDELSGSQMTLKFQILCRNQDQLKVKRALNREVRLMLARNGFIIPFPQVTISTRRNREEDEEEEMEREKEEEMEREENKEQTE